MPLKSMPCGKPLFFPSKQYITTAFYIFVGTAVIPHMETSQPVECGSKPLDVQFAIRLRMTAIFAPIQMIEDQLAALVARNGIFAGDPTHRSCRRRREGTGCRRSCQGWRRSEPVDTAQDVGEQVTRNDNLVSCHSSNVG